MRTFFDGKGDEFPYNFVPEKPPGWLNPPHPVIRTHSSIRNVPGVKCDCSRLRGLGDWNDWGHTCQTCWHSFYSDQCFMDPKTFDQWCLWHTPPRFFKKRVERKGYRGRIVDKQLRFAIFERDHFTCRYCGSSPLTDPTVRLELDHLHPWSKGGSLEDKLNGVTACFDCNRGKRDRLLAADLQVKIQQRT